MIVQVMLLFVCVTARPWVSFQPDVAKIVFGESIALTCNMASPEQGKQTYTWYRDNKRISSGQRLYINAALGANSGDYQCQTGTSERSEAVRLEVTEGYVTLQTPPTVYEGDSLILRCHSPVFGASSGAAFYKDGTALKSSSSDSSLSLGTVYKNTSGTYRCSKSIFNARPVTDKAFISVKDLFSKPHIQVSSNETRVGANVTVTCSSTLTPARRSTELRFVFNKDGRSMQDIQPSNELHIRGAWVEQSGYYTCEVEAVASRIKKISNTLYIQIKEFQQNEVHLDYTLQNAIRLTLSVFLSVLCLCFVCNHLKRENT
ncbi:Fc receptor-like protein 5 [Xenopus laevis]|uniref:Fc receptor-like protein 5 n=1 Tax=Xenopus laevis TaxID=8355 RepID=A0A8J0TE77_XENLA|nr:Fc receptor-like protein 5 [Xenopus laevis]